MGQSRPISSTAGLSNRRGPRAIAADLKRQIRTRAKGSRSLTWSVPIGSMSDQDLDQVLAILARTGIAGSYERELGFIAHFLMVW